MSEANAAEAQVGTPKLQLLGSADAESCDGDFCELPAHREQAVMNRRIDEDRI